MGRASGQTGGTLKSKSTYPTARPPASPCTEGSTTGTQLTSIRGLQLLWNLCFRTASGVSSRKAKASSNGVVKARSRPTTTTSGQSEIGFEERGEREPPNKKYFIGSVSDCVNECLAKCE